MPNFPHGLTIGHTFGSPITQTVTISSKGQLVIPKVVRELTQLSAGDELIIICVNGEIHLKPTASNYSATALEDVAGCLAKPTRQRLSNSQTRARMAAKRKEKNAVST